MPAQLTTASIPASRGRHAAASTSRVKSQATESMPGMAAREPRTAATGTCPARSSAATTCMPMKP